MHMLGGDNMWWITHKLGLFLFYPLNRISLLHFGINPHFKIYLADETENIEEEFRDLLTSGNLKSDQTMSICPFKRVVFPPYEIPKTQIQLSTALRSICC